MDPEASGRAGRTRVAPVGDDAARARRLRSQVRFQRAGELLQSVEQGDEVAVVRDLVHVLDARGQAVHVRRERELHDLEGQLGARGLLGDATQPCAVQRCRHQARARTALRQEEGEVDHGDGVALRHEGDDNEVRWRRWWRWRISSRFIRGRHGRRAC
uniref:Uncharacterized protein n=1 Tax=Zea mays TaxID=4577 RepID=C0PJ91_MAIZE|nr:unknown [Zea mays]